MDPFKERITRYSLHPKILVVGFVASAVASIGGLGWMVFHAVEMVRNGRGGETYRTFWLVEYDWFGFLAVLIGVVVALVIAGVFQLRERAELRQLEKKYQSND